MIKKFLRRFVLIVFISFLLSPNSNADDISELEIEGFSIGDSLLKYFSLDEIKSNTIADYKEKKIRFLP